MRHRRLGDAPAFLSADLQDEHILLIEVHRHRAPGRREYQREQFKMRAQFLAERLVKTAQAGELKTDGDLDGCAQTKQRQRRCRVDLDDFWVNIFLFFIQICLDDILETL